MATIGQHYTRGNSRKLTVMRCRFDLWKYCFTNRIVNMWNTLPDNVILADNVNQFKNRLDKQVVQTALTATFNSYGNRQISTPPPQNRYPWTDQQTTRHNWLRPRENPYTKYGTNRPAEGFWANGWNITKNYFLIYTFFLRFAYRSDPWMDFYARQLKRREITQGCAFLGLNNVPLNFGGKTSQKLKSWGRE